ncbi:MULTISPECIES: hypothetical protein [unclassified Ornithinimicrobium]|uniref:hypothetical protein n=1 Tax=unclassified Ornithinimicrobium TaxID=2615080 RepID=UPI003852F10C
MSAVLPRFRHWLGWGLPALGILGAVALRVTESLGEVLEETSAAYQTETVHDHAEWGEQAGTAGLFLAGVSLLMWFLTSPYARGRWTSGWPAWLTRVTQVVAVAVALLTTAAVTLAGHSGAASVWTG